MKIEIDLDILEKTDLTSSELLFLQIVFFNRAKEIYYLKYLGQLDYYSLQDRGYIKFNPEKMSVSLREKALLLFRVNVDVFKEFYTTYPYKTDDGRQLRTKDINTNLYKTTRSSWNRIFKGKPDDALKALETLKEEIAYRENNDKMQYFKRIDNWLSEGHYQHTYDEKDIKPKNNSTSYGGLSGFDEM